MKLIDILVNELDVWPTGALCASQSRIDAEIYFKDAYAADFYASCRADDGYNDGDYLEITQEEWEAARNKSPVVGRDYEIIEGTCSWEAQDKWQIGEIVTVRAVFKNQHRSPMYAVETKHSGCVCIVEECLRVAKTEDEKQKEAEIKQMASDLDIPRAIAARAWEKGYRKESK